MKNRNRHIFQYIGIAAGIAAFFIILSIPTPNGLQDEAWKAIAAGSLMVIWWMSEAVPLPVTALMPIILFPGLGIFDIRSATAPYGSPIIFLFMGGFILAIALEKWKLHERFALIVIRITGTKPRGIIAGFMIATATISMWISNTATTVMMIPIATSVISLLHQKGLNDTKFTVCLMLSIAYAANIGGTATIIGTPPNAVLVGFLNESGYNITFGTWLIIGLPFACILLTLTYFILTYILYPPRHNKTILNKEIINDQLSKLGTIGQGEKSVLIIFVLVALAWIFRGPLQLPLTDSGIAMLGAIILFIIPVKSKEGFVLTWSDMKNIPWGILILFGGGLTLAKALHETGVILSIGEALSATTWSIFSLILVISFLALFMTEFMSNVALTTVLVPVMFGVAQGLSAAPLMFTIPVALAASCAFMMPVSTPPNAIVFSSGHLKVSQMARAGFVLNIIALIVLTLLTHLIIDHLA